jgi:hypothetical protein
MLNSLRKYGLARTTKILGYQFYRWACRRLHLGNIRTIYGPRMVAHFSDKTFVFSARGA